MNSPSASPIRHSFVCEEQNTGLAQIPAHRMSYCSWGRPNASHLIICVHGLTRQAFDFDVLASTLTDPQDGLDAYVVATDVIGRGESDWLPATYYQIPVYVADHVSLLSHLFAKVRYQRISWVGTSMGGLIGMGICAMASSKNEARLLPNIDNLVLNDVGPALNLNGLSRISEYVGKHMNFSSEELAISHLADISKGFGPHTEKEWRALSMPMLRHTDSGVRLHYDPAIAKAFTHITPTIASSGEQMLWQAYDHISAKTLLVRGAESDLLSRETALEMTERGPKAKLLEFADTGHAPTFVRQSQIEVLRTFLA